MRQFHINAYAKKDFLVCLSVWFALELFCFLLLPVLGLGQPNDLANQWLLPSISAGIIGAFLFAVSSQLLLIPVNPGDRWMNFSRSLGGIILAWVGLLGVATPLLLMSIRICLKLFQVSGLTS
jgi:hypothetical protein